jgi:hypothetical protein
MKWSKLKYNAKANTHRAGWAFWYLIIDDADVCTIRYIPNLEADYRYEILPNGPDAFELGNYSFKTLKEAKAYATAYFVNQRLDESL